MATKPPNREELEKKVMDRVTELIKKYSYSAERGMEELEKEITLLQVKADNTEISADERMVDTMLGSVILGIYAFELTIIPHLKEE